PPRLKKELPAAGEEHPQRSAASRPAPPAVTSRGALRDQHVARRGGFRGGILIPPRLKKEPPAAGEEHPQRSAASRPAQPAVTSRGALRDQTRREEGGFAGGS